MYCRLRINQSLSMPLGTTPSEETMKGRIATSLAALVTTKVATGSVTN
jgi:hypothetical protein